MDGALELSELPAYRLIVKVIDEVEYNLTEKLCRFKEFGRSEWFLHNGGEGAESPRRVWLKSVAVLSEAFLEWCRATGNPTKTAETY